MSARITFDGDTSRAERRFRSLEVAAGDLTPVWTGLGKTFRDLVEQRVASQGFAPLSDAYRREKAREGLDGRILYRTGASIESLTSSLDVFRVEPQSLVIGSRSQALRFQAKGRYDARTGRRVPRRQPVPVGAFHRRVAARVRRHLVQAAKPL